MTHNGTIIILLALLPTLVTTPHKQLVFKRQKKLLLDKMLCIPTSNMIVLHERREEKTEIKKKMKKHLCKTCIAFLMLYGVFSFRKACRTMLNKVGRQASTRINRKTSLPLDNDINFSNAFDVVASIGRSFHFQKIDL
jgi:hypothetical protein